MSASSRVAILMWGNAVEEFLEPLGLSVQAFAKEMTGGWLFGYAAALRRAGIETTIVCVSREVDRDQRHIHGPTGAVIRVLPLPRAYRVLASSLHNPSATFGQTHAPSESKLPRWMSAIVHHVAPYLPLSPRRLARVLREERIDALVVQEYESARFDVAVGVGRALGVPVYATFQGGTWHVSGAERFVRPLALKGAAGLIIPSADEVKRVRSRYGVPASKVASIVNPLHLEEWGQVSREAARQALQVSQEAEVVVWHGRVDMVRKGLDVLLDAWTRVVAERPGRDLRLRLMGTGPDADRFRDRVAEGPASIDWRDEYVLDRADLHQHLASGDVYVLPSRHEGFPVALVEACAAGLPAVAAAAPGVRDILGEAGSAHVVPTGDAHALAEALGHLLDHADERHCLGRMARQQAEARFGLDAVGEQLASFLFSPARGVAEPVRARESPAARAAL